MGKDEDKAARLEKIAEEVRHLETSPLYEYREENGYRPVPGEGNPDARLMLVGEAPGAQEAESGRPFVGRAGRVLDVLLASIALDRGDVYITNVVKDRPPGNRDPHVEEIDLYGPLLLRQIDIIQPDVIAALGRFATDFVLRGYDLPQRGKRISELHGEVIEASASYGAVGIVPLYHPAAAFYNPDLEDTLQQDMQAVKHALVQQRGQEDVG